MESESSNEQNGAVENHWYSIYPGQTVSKTEFRVDCRGMNWLLDKNPPIHEIRCVLGGDHVRYIVPRLERMSFDYHLALFLDKEAYQNDVFLYPRRNRVCVLSESPIMDCYRDLNELRRRFDVIFTHQVDLSEQGMPFVPLEFGTNWIGVYQDDGVAVHADTCPTKSKMTSFVGSLLHDPTGAYRLRYAAAKLAVNRVDVDCFGRGISEIAHKREAIAPYRFSIAMENTVSNLYFSEKLIDCILLETVPIYYGCDGVEKVLDSRGMLPFRTLDELSSILDSLSPSLYESMRPFLLKNKQTVIAHRWHSHSAMFGRITSALLPKLRITKPLNPRRGVRSGLGMRALRAAARRASRYGKGLSIRFPWV